MRHIKHKIYGESAKSFTDNNDIIAWISEFRHCVTTNPIGGTLTEILSFFHILIGG